VIERLATNARVVFALGARSVKQTARRPQLAAPLFVFPTLLLAVQTGGAGQAINLPQFPPVQSFLAFMLAGAMIQGVLLAGNSGAIALAIDIEMGFTDRLFAAPISRFSIVLGRLAATGMLGVVVALWFIAIGLIFGATIHEGFLGAIWIVLMVSASAVAFGSVAAALALRTGSASVTQGIFPLLFVILFLSSAFFPANLMLEPASAIANYNPLSFIVEGVREPVISGFSGHDELKGLASVLGILALGLAMSAAAVRGRAKRG
jgi:ABC-type multidrug transport system permease subunit